MEEASKTMSQNSFINHVFRFDDDTKSDLMNIAQYVALALLPTSILHHLVNSIVPKIDKSKGNIELIIEVFGEFFIVLFGLFFIHRIIDYIPTYSGKALGSMNIFSIMLLFMISRHEEEDSKVKLLINRGYELWNGTEKQEPQKDTPSNNPIVQISKNQHIQQPPQSAPTHQTSRADYVNSHNRLLPEPPTMNHTGGNGASNAMYQQNNANAQPHSEPMAANEGFGGFTSF
tara:strand:- start:446 stop:1138 length:693 start_codon:yes stop_codon:yes gene_type:complete